MTRTEAIKRYRHLRAVSKQHFNAATKFVSRPTMMEYGRKLGLVFGDTFICDSADDLSYVFDLSLYASKDGRSRGIDRYARSVCPAPNSDEALMLRAAQAARFTVCYVEGPHETAGLSVRDLVREQTLRLMDEGFEATMPAGMLLATRLKPVEDFVMTTGAAVPLDRPGLSSILSDFPRPRIKSAADVIEDYRFAIAVFRAHLSGETGMKVEHRDSWEPLESAAA